MNWDMIKGQVQNLISQHTENQSGTGFNPAPLLGEVEQLFNQRTGNSGFQTDPTSLMNDVKGLIAQHADNQSQTGFNPGQLLGDVENLFRQQL